MLRPTRLLAAMIVLAPAMTVSLGACSLGKTAEVCAAEPRPAGGGAAGAGGGGAAGGRAEAWSIDAGNWRARWAAGSLVGLQRADGRVLVGTPKEVSAATMHRIQTTHPVVGHRRPAALRDEAVVGCYETLKDLPGATLMQRIQWDRTAGEMIVRQQSRSPQKGLWGVGWTIADIPLDYAILVPGTSGVKLTTTTPGSRWQYDYPMMWEAQLVVVEGPGHGFYVWAADPNGRAKRLVVDRRAGGWQLSLISINDAPFDALSTCDSVPWRIGCYDGSWRVPAQRYRRWMLEHFQPTPVAKQQPTWVRDIRACSIMMGLSHPELEALAERVDPKQTLLYLPNWRTPGYDRDYPNYDDLVPQLMPFLHRARELGFRTMLHVNYFGVDPKHPRYAEFQKYQVLDPWGDHARQWWLWERADPIIKFAYINPAHKGWRDLFTAAMTKLCKRTGADALHLDQTLCIYNDHNGRIDGLSMLEGNVALHRQLREAMPQVALSGEGLNEVTCRYEAFAQRHIWGLDHTNGTWDRGWLAASHPISSYLFRPYTVIYGYLGCASPESGQLFAAWNDAYEHWGVIPTLVSSLGTLRKPEGFARQRFDEIAFWQREKVEIDVEGPWPAETAFPLRTGDGRRAEYTVDGRLVCGERTVLRTIHGVQRVDAPGTILGWAAYNRTQLLGLDPQRWYPYVDQPRRHDVFHCTQLPDGVSADAIVALDGVAMVGGHMTSPTVADLSSLLDRAVCGARPFAAAAYEALGPLEAPDGATFTAQGNVLAAHPPYKGPQSGEAFARYTVALPRDVRLHFVAQVALAPGAAGPGKSDGVTFRVGASAGGRTLHAEVHQATTESKDLTLDLTPLAGATATIELSIHPGPANSPTFDWARWQAPRIQREFSGEGTVGVAGGAPWRLALQGPRQLAIRSAGDAASPSQQQVRAVMPGTVVFLREAPPASSLPIDLERRPFQTLLLDATGRQIESARFTGIHPMVNAIGGASRRGFFAHPPNHGRTVAIFVLTLPENPARFRSFVGLRDRSFSTGVVFSVEANGQEVAKRRMKPGGWEPLEADLRAWAGKPVVLAMVTDSDGPFDADWACWGEPALVPAQVTPD